MGTLWTMLHHSLPGGGHDVEAIVETEASTNVICECCSTRSASTPREISEHIKDDDSGVCR